MIRGGNSGDSAAMGRIYCEAWKKAYDGIVPGEFLERLTPEMAAPPPERISPDNCFVYDTGDGAIGLVSFGPCRDEAANGAAEIYSIYVLPVNWKSGIGSQLFAAAKDKLAYAGYKKLILWTLTENRRARAFYEKMGMREYSKRTTEIAGKALPETGYEMDI